VLASIHLRRCELRGIVVIVTSGWRSPDEQMNLFAKGRQMDPATGVWNIVDRRLVVTNAMPNEAPHCRGAAYDICPLVAEKPAWDRLDLFQAVAECRPSELAWGGAWQGNFKDHPHFELFNWRNLPLKDTL